MLDVLAIRVVRSIIRFPISGRSVTELLQNLCHLVSTLSTSDIDDDIGVRPFCDLVLCHGFSGSESAWDCSSAAFGDGEQSIQDTLTGKQRNCWLGKLVGRSRNTDRPFLCQCDSFSVPSSRRSFTIGLKNGILSVRQLQITVPCEMLGGTIDL